MNFFGRPGGPARLVLSVVSVGVLGVFAFVIFNLNHRLDNQQHANATSLTGSTELVSVNDKLTNQLAQLTQLTHTAQTALGATSALGPLLTKLDQAIAPAAGALATSTSNTETTNDQLTNIQNILGEIQNTVVPLVSSAATFGDQGKQLLTTVRALVNDLQGSVSAAQTINRMLPLPG